MKLHAREHVTRNGVCPCSPETLTPGASEDATPQSHQCATLRVTIPLAEGTLVDFLPLTTKVLLHQAFQTALDW